MRHPEGVFKAACSAGSLQQPVCKRGVLLSVLPFAFLHKDGAVERSRFFGTGFGMLKRVITGGTAGDDCEAAELFRSQFRKRQGKKIPCCRGKAFGLEAKRKAVKIEFKNSLF